MTVEPKRRPDEGMGCCCGTADRASDEAQPQKVQAERLDEHPTATAQTDLPSRSKGCCCGS